MQDGLTLDQLRAARALLQKHAIPPGTVMTQAEADELTRNDPRGHVWRVGERYYRVETLHGTMAAPGDEATA